MPAQPLFSNDPLTTVIDTLNYVKRSDIKLPLIEYKLNLITLYDRLLSIAEIAKNCVIPTQVVYLNTLGKYAMKLDRYDVAKLHFEEALKLDETDKFSLTGYGQALIKLNRFPKAIEVFKKAEIYHPNDPEIKRQLGISYYNNCQYIDALDAFEKYKNIALANDLLITDITKLYVADCFSSTGEYVKATKIYDRILSHKDSSVSVRNRSYNSLALIHIELGNFSEAERLAKLIEVQSHRKTSLNYQKILLGALYESQSLYCENTEMKNQLLQKALNEYFSGFKETKSHLLALAVVRTLELLGKEEDIDKFKSMYPEIAKITAINIALSIFEFCKKNNINPLKNTINHFSELNPSTKNLSIKALILASQNNLKDALVTVNLAYSKDPYSKFSIYAKARIHILRNEYDLASEVLLKIISTNKIQDQGMLSLAVLCAKRDKKLNEELIKKLGLMLEKKLITTTQKDKILNSTLSNQILPTEFLQFNSALY